MDPFSHPLKTAFLVVFIDEIPKTSVGKFDKKVLRERSFVPTDLFLASNDLTRSVRLLTPLLAELSSVFTRQVYRESVGYNCWNRRDASRRRDG